MRFMGAMWRFAVGAMATLGAPLAWGHGLDADRVELVLRGDAVESVATPPVAFVRWADADGDGRLTLDELNPRREAVRDALVAALHVTDEAGREGAVERADVSLPHGHDGDVTAGRSFLRVTVVRRWRAAPRAVQVRCDFARVRPVTVYATRAEAATPGVLTLVGDPELVRLAAADASVTLLRAAPPAPAPVASHASAPAPTVPPSAPWLGLAVTLGATLTFSFALMRRRSLRPHPGEAS